MELDITNTSLNVEVAVTGENPLSLDVTVPQGADGIVFTLDKPTMGIAALSDGSSPVLTDAAISASIMRGINNDTANWTIGATPVGCTGSLVDHTTYVTFTVATMTSDTATVTFAATRSGFSSLSKVATLTKLKQPTIAAIVAAFPAASTSVAGKIQLPSVSGFAPMPVAGSSDADIGRLRRFIGDANAGFVLPAGGTWSYYGTRRGPNKKLVGTPLPITNVGVCSIAALDNQYFAQIDIGNRKLTTYKFDGSTFTKIGNHLSITNITYPCMKRLTSTSVVLYDANAKTIQTYAWNGTDWSTAGNALTMSDTGDIAGIAMLTSTTIAFAEGNCNKLRTYSFNGTDWSLVGNQLSLASINNPALCPLSATRVAFVDDGYKSLRAYDWDGTNWTVQAGALSISASAAQWATAKLSSTNIVMADTANKRLREYSYASGAWVQVGAGLVLTGTFTSMALAYLEPTILAYGYIVFLDSSNDTLMAFSYDASMGMEFEEVSSVAAGGTTVGTATDGYYWSGWIKKEA